MTRSGGPLLPAWNMPKIHEWQAVMLAGRIHANAQEHGYPKIRIGLDTGPALLLSRPRRMYGLERISSQIRRER